jgi:hypothetical protein
MIDLRSLPMLYDDSIQDFSVTSIVPSSLPDIGVDLISHLYTMDEQKVIPPYFFPYIQHERISKIPFHVNSYLKMLIFSSNYMFHTHNTFQIEHIRHPETFGVYTVSVDDYYIHQSTLSEDLFKKYEEFFEFIHTNMIRESNVLSLLLKNASIVEKNIKHMNEQLEKYQRNSHYVSSIYQRVFSQKHLHSLLPKVIDVVFVIFRVQFQYLLSLENQYYSLTFHGRNILSNLKPKSM